MIGFFPHLDPEGREVWWSKTVGNLFQCLVEKLGRPSLLLIGISSVSLFWGLNLPCLLIDIPFDCIQFVFFHLSEGVHLLFKSLYLFLQNRNQLVINA